MADDLFNILASSARIKKKPKSHHKKRILSEDEGIKSNFAVEQLLSSKFNKSNEQVHTEEIAAFRRRMRIRVADPQNCADPICTFREMTMKNTNNTSNKLFAAVKSVLLSNIEQGQWKEPTAVQMQAIPALLDGHDVMAAAPTGSGKSGAFILPSIFHAKCGGNKADQGKRGIRALLLAPSRELAAQLHREVTRFGSTIPGKLRTALLSKSNYGSFVAGKLGGEANGLDILVTTPLRLCEALQAENSKVDLSGVRIVTLDEADRLLDATDGVTKSKNSHSDNHGETGNKESGGAHVRTFVEQIDTILGACGHQAIRAMFSATMGGKIRNLAETVLRNPVDVAVNSHGGAVGANTDIDQSLVFVGREDGKLLEIRKHIVKGMKPPVLIFLQSQERAQALYKELRYEKVNGMYLLHPILLQFLSSHP